MITLKKNIGRLQVGKTIITDKTPQEAIERIINQNPDLVQYFDGLKTKSNARKKGNKSTSKKE